MADISKIHLEGARIVRVIEDVDSHSLAFEVSYPMPDGGSEFPRRRFIFQCCTRYVFDEGHSAGEPVVQRVEVIALAPHRVTTRIHTDHGLRELTCSRSVVEENLL